MIQRSRTRRSAALDTWAAEAVATLNRALITVLWHSGLRLAEALALLPGDVDDGQGVVVVRVGKGHASRCADQAL